jgi:DNA-binding HxlR family transcriptional regulator
MVPKSSSRHGPDVQEILTSICSKWAVLILFELARGRTRHGELQRAIRGISQKVLTQTLRQLERDRLVQRTVYPVVPPGVEYALTPLGTTLMQPLKALYRWMERSLRQIQQARRASARATGSPTNPPLGD